MCAQVYSKYFLKEGVVHAMEQLALSAPPPEPPPAPPPVDTAMPQVPPATAAAAAQKEAKKETRASTRLRVCGVTSGMYYARQSVGQCALGRALQHVALSSIPAFR